MIKNLITKERIPFLIFLFLSLLITIFPPFSWGDERLSTQRERYTYYYGKRADVIFPIKQYDFIFNNIKKEIPVGWGWDYSEQKSVMAYISLTRHLITSELIINYLIAFFISLIIFLFNDKSHYRFKKNSIQNP